MPAALPTLAQLDEQLTSARSELVVAEDAGDTIGALLTRARIDALLDRRHTLQQQHVDV